MRTKYCDQETVFSRIWDAADCDGIWDGSSTTLAGEFGVTVEEAHTELSELCDRNRIQRIGKAKYIISRWRDREESQEGLLC